MSDDRDLHRRIEFDGPVSLSMEAGGWGLLLKARLRITAPEREPPLVFVTLETRLKENPTTSPEELCRWILELLADRLGMTGSEDDPPGTA